MILCDLPYGTTNCAFDTIIPFEPLWQHYKRIIKDNGAIVLTACQPFTSALVMSNPEMFKYEWIWRKPQGTGFLNAKKQPLRNHESILVFYKKQPVYNPQFTKGKPYTTNRNKNTAQVYNHFETVDTVNVSGDRYPVTVLDCKRDKEKLFPTQKPVQLFEYLIRTYTNEGDTVLDNCAGSGTSGIACINTNRNYILMEKDEHYYNMIKERIASHRLLTCRA